MRREDPAGCSRSGTVAAIVVLGGLLGGFVPPGAASPPEPPFDPGVMAEWTCYPAFERAGNQGIGPCGCAWPGSCGDRAPAGCYCDERCGAEGDCCPDAGLCAEDPS